jgi:hypothetical protein
MDISDLFPGSPVWVRDPAEIWEAGVVHAIKQADSHSPPRGSGLSGVSNISNKVVVNTASGRSLTLDPSKDEIYLRNDATAAEDGKSGGNTPEKTGGDKDENLSDEITVGTFASPARKRAKDIAATATTMAATCAESPSSMTPSNTLKVLPIGDLTQLIYLHEPAVLHVLHERFKLDSIYTFTGPILIAVNPFKVIDGLYSREKMREFFARDELLEIGIEGVGMVNRVSRELLDDENNNTEGGANIKRNSGNTYNNNAVVRQSSNASTSSASAFRNGKVTPPYPNDVRRLSSTSASGQLRRRSNIGRNSYSNSSAVERRISGRRSFAGSPFVALDGTRKSIVETEVDRLNATLQSTTLNPHEAVEPAGMVTRTVKPHVFSTANSAFQGLQDNGRSQTVLISGESGEGIQASIPLRIIA